MTWETKRTSRMNRAVLTWVSWLALATVSCASGGENLVGNPSFQEVKPAVNLIASFESNNPFTNFGAPATMELVEEHATDGKKALKFTGHACMDGPQNWQGYDYLKADFFNPAKIPTSLYVQVQDNQTKDYWTWVNHNTVLPPGQSTFVLPLRNLFVGERGNPGRNVILNGIKRLYFALDGKEPSAIYLDNLRLERDDSLKQVAFEGLYAFSLQPASGPGMMGFTQVNPSTVYDKQRGYGLLNAKVWRPDMSNVNQPDPLYQAFLCIESGGFAVDVPNGKYHVFVNIDNPSGFWGEFQTYSSRKILAQGREVLNETMNFDSFKKRYFRFWDTEDLPTENTFDKYLKVYFQEKQFDVDVTDGQLKIEFQGVNWACSVSCIVAYPASKAAQGEKFLKWVEEKRRFYFDNGFKRVLHAPSGDPLHATEADKRRGYVAFQRDGMKNVYYNDTPYADELGKPVNGDAFAGELAPLSLAVLPLQDLGQVTLTTSDLSKQEDKIPASVIDIGYVSYRVTRVDNNGLATPAGSIYSLYPRYVMPRNTVAMPKDVARRFWMTVHVPADAKPGLYNGEVTLKSTKGFESSIPVELLVRKGALDPMDIPVGPIGCTNLLPFDDPAARQWEQDKLLKNLQKMREYGFTACAGIPNIIYKGFQAGKPVLDFVEADKWMKTAKELGFLAMHTYGCGVTGINAYYKDEGQMRAAGFKDYAEFLKAIYTEVQKHANENGWITVYYNLGDENPGEPAVQNAEAYRKAFPKGPPYFTALFSFKGTKREDPAFRWAKALHVAGWALHDEDSVNLLHQEGGDWGIYNIENRWTFGDYLYKAAKQFNLKYRLAWHWCGIAGDPFYALDSREDDYAWCNATPDGGSLPCLDLFERLREGLGDYRRLLTLARLAKEKAGTPEAAAAEKLINDRLSSFKLGQIEHDALFGVDDWKRFRTEINASIELLRK